MSKGQVVLFVGLLISLSALSGCSVLSLNDPSDAELAAEESQQVAALVKKLNSHPTGFFGQAAEAERREAAWDLGHQFTAYSAIPDLTRALKDDDQIVRCNAAASLWNMADHASSAQAALKEVLNDSYSRVRLNAVRALNQMGVPNDELMPTLNDVAAGSGLLDAVNAADLLISMGQDPKTLIRVLMRGMADHEVSETVISNLGDQAQDPAYLPVLLIGAKSASDKVRSESVGLLGTGVYASPEVAAVIRKAASDWSEDVRRAASQALVVGGYSSDFPAEVVGPGAGAANESIAMLLKLLHDRSELVRRDTAESLGRLKVGSPEVVAALRETLKDSDTEVRSQAAEALGALGKSAMDAVPQLWAIWNDSRKIVERPGLRGLKDRDDIEFGGDAGKALEDITGDPVRVFVIGWYDGHWKMNPTQVRAAFENYIGISVTEESGPPTVLRITSLDCGCGTATRCVWACATSHTASEVTIPVSVSFVFDASAQLSKVLLKSHVGDLSRCQAIDSILPGLEWTYSTSHTTVQSRSPEATASSYEWTLYKSSLTYKTESTPAACEVELDYATAAMQ